MSTVVRQIIPEDVAAIAAIHAASWRSAYRGILRDEFLDTDLTSNRVTLWERRLSLIPPNNFGYLATIAERASGFAFAFGAHDPIWGTQIDNLHVLPERKGSGIGRQLLEAVCTRAEVAHPDVGLYLWVYERNQAACLFYERLAGRLVERLLIEPPGGGKAAELRYVWSSPGQLMHALRGNA